MKSKVDKLDVDKLIPVPVDLSKLSDVVKNDVVKKDVYNAKIKNIEDKIPDITNLATKTTLNAKINEVKGEIPNITNLATTSALTAVENKIPSVSNLVKKTDYNTKINEIDNHDKYINTLEFNKLKSKNFAARLKQANFVNKADFDDKLKIQIKKIIHVLVENELNELTKKLLSTKGCSFFLGGIYFASADELQNMFVYQPTFSTIKYHNTRIEYTISWRSKVLYIIDLIPINNDLLSNIKYFNKKVALQFDYNSFSCTSKQLHNKNCKCLHRV